MKRRLIFGFIGVLLAVNLVIGAKVYSNSSDSAPKDVAYPNIRLFSEVMEKVRRDYVDGTNLTYQDLVYGYAYSLLGDWVMYWQLLTRKIPFEERDAGTRQGADRA